MSYHEDMGYNTPNFKTQGGDISAFEGTVVFTGNVVFEDGSTLSGVPLPQADYQETSGATTVAQLKDDFNALREKLINAGLMKNK